MAVLTTKHRDQLASNQFALSGERFPINDVAHARAALQDAPKSVHAGNISAAEEKVVQRKANHFLDSHEGQSRHADSVKGS